ncbi:MAG: protein translocase subunit SecDF [Alistipes sp.]|jgi:SecD/SecF fusion protein|nr:protein translocase subunit SecDF [Alistipes sp.]
MQNKGALRFLTVLLVLACAYQLSFTLVTKLTERKATQYAAANYPAQEQEAARGAYLDSIGTKKIYLGFTYKECQEREINLGLDLRGGMNVMMQISVEDVVRAMSGDSKDPVFTAAMAEARTAQGNSSQDFISLFADAYDRLSGGAPLAYIFNTPDLKEEILPTSTNEQVLTVLRERTDGAISNSFNVLRNRIDRFGVANPNIQRLDNGRVLIELPGVKEPERVRKLLQGTASLEFWATFDNNEIFGALAQANEEVARLNEIAAAPAAEVAEDAAAEEGAAATEAVEGAEETAEVAETPAAEAATTISDDAVLAEIADAGSAELGAVAADRNDLFAKLIPMGPGAPGPIIGMAASYDTAAVNKMLALPQVKAMLPRELRLMWGVMPSEMVENMFELYAVNANTRDGKAPLDGGVIVDARADYRETGSDAEVSMTMNSAGARTWANLTRDNIGKSVAIVLDGYVYSAPTVNDEISGGRSSITGNFTIQLATDLANVLESGKLPAPARIIQDSVVGPSLGRDSINSGMMSFIIAFIVTLLYMCIYYNRAGWYSSIALVTNLFLLFGVLVSFGAVLTLPGIAGIVLTMGMAVDANVIIYERIKEELRAGKGLGLAVIEGYKNAMSAIIDGNLTTVITGIVLFVFGTGPVQGFATTLIIGIITSLFTSIFIARLLIDDRIVRGKKVSFARKWNANFLTDTKFDFIGKRKISYIISGALILVTFVSIFTRGFNMGVDFSGGRAYVVHFDQPVTDEVARERMSAVFDGIAEGGASSWEVKTYGTDGTDKRILLQYKFDDESDEATAEVNQLLWEAMNPLFVTPLTLEEFNSTQDVFYGIIQSDKVGPSVAHDITRNSVIAVVFSLLAIGLYIFVRVRKWQWGMGAVISLAHNAAVVFGLFSLFWGVLPFALEIDQSFIAAILTIIGYSINDTVVIFDRIREYHTLYPKRSMFENINGAINSTLGRTMNTSGTTIITLLAIFLFGGTVIRGFILALLVGIVVGTYSSVFVATPVAYDMMKKNSKKQ